MKTYSCGLNWFGPFTNIQQVKEWEDSNGNDTYLYLNRGKKKYAKKVSASYGGTGDRSVSCLLNYFITFEIIFLTIPAGQ